MSYQRVYPQRINWEDEPSLATPINQVNLNKMDSALYGIDGRVIELDENKVGKTETFNTSQNGVVPKPTQADIINEKVLRADGSWVTQTGGGGAGMLPKLIITGEAESTITILSPSLEQITPTSISETVWIADVEEYGDYVITATKSGSSIQRTVSVNVVQIYNITMASFEAFINVTFPDNATVSCSAPGQETQYATTSPHTFTVNASATYTITGTRSGVTETQTVVITTSGQSENVTLTIVPDGSTVTPTDDVQTWLRCADIWDKAYTTISEVLADSTTLSALMASSNAVDYLVRSTTWVSDVCADSSAMSYIGLNNYCANTLLADSDWLDGIANSTYKESVLNVKVPTMTSATTPSGEVSESSSYNSGYAAWKAFDGIDEGTTNTGWMTANNPVSAYMQYDFGRTFKPYVYVIRPYSDRGNCRTTEFKMQGAIADTFSDISEVQTFPNGTTSATVKTFVGNVHTNVKKVRLLVTGSQDTYYGCNALQIYGREDV